MSNMDLTGLRRLLCYSGENLYIYRKKTPIVKLGEEKLYKPL
jgi:hypothetical protein